jgi:hypothetical protein
MSWNRKFSRLRYYRQRPFKLSLHLLFLFTLLLLFIFVLTWQLLLPQVFLGWYCAATSTSVILRFCWSNFFPLVPAYGSFRCVRLLHLMHPAWWSAIVFVHSIYSIYISSAYEDLLFQHSFICVVSSKPRFNYALKV